MFKRRPDEYERPPRCRDCGKSNFRVDAWMMKRDTHGQACTCAGYWFWHRRGSLYCWYRKDGSDRLPGDVDFADRNMTPDELAA